MKLGKHQSDLLDWLKNKWLTTGGQNVCLIEGFSGNGKTRLAQDFQQSLILSGYKPCFVALPDGSFSMEDFFLMLAGDLSNIGYKSFEEAIFGNKKAEAAFVQFILNEPVCIIIDNFQNLLNEHGVPNPVLKTFLHDISLRASKARILMLSNQVVSKEKWTESIAFKTLLPLTNDEASNLLAETAREANIGVDFGELNKSDILNFLGNNPRAINTLVQCLRWESMDALIGKDPELWELQDREFSPELLRQLEEKLVRQNMGRLNEYELGILESLSVIRKPFETKVIDKVESNKEKSFQLRQALTQYYFLERQQFNFFILHPTVREICRYNLSLITKPFRKAHKEVGRYYARHFYHDEIKGTPAKWGGDFVEARYHFTQAHAQDELSKISTNLREFIRTFIIPTSPAPHDPQALDERIALLMAFLNEENSSGLAFHLAKCLLKRGRQDDLRLALSFILKSRQHSASEETWLLWLKLEALVNGKAEAIQKGIDAKRYTAAFLNKLAGLLVEEGQRPQAIALLKDSIGKIPASSNLFSLYQFCAELLNQEGQRPQAIALLKDGIGKIPADKSLSSLYTFCAELMNQEGQRPQAIALLKDGIGKIPADKSLSSLYTFCAELMKQEGQRPQAIALLQDGISKIPTSSNLFSLYQFCAELMNQEGQRQQAIALLKDGIRKIPVDKGMTALLQSCAEMLIADDRLPEALDVYKDGIIKSPSEALFISYSNALIMDMQYEESTKVMSIIYLQKQTTPILIAYANALARTKKTKEAIALLKDGIGKIPADKSLSSLYTFCAELMNQEGQRPQAIALLKDGIRKIPASSNLFSLYTFCAELLNQEGQRTQAIALLQDGIGKIPADKSLVSLYVSCAEMMNQEGQRPQAIALLKDGIGKIPAEYGSVLLYQLLSFIYFLNGDLTIAKEVLEEGIVNIPEQYAQYKLYELKAQQLYATSNIADLQSLTAKHISQVTLINVLICFLEGDYKKGILTASTLLEKGNKFIPVISQQVVGLLVMEQNEKAWELVSKMIDETYNESTAWIYTLTALKINHHSLAKRGMELLTKQPFTGIIEVKDLVRYWWETGKKLGPFPYLFYPHLPASITGFNRQLSFFSPTIESDLEEYFHAIDNTPQTEAVMDKQTIQNLISKNNIEEAIHALKKALHDTTPVISLETQWNQLKSDDIMGILSFSEKTQRQNQITSGLLKLSSMLSEPAQPNAQPETIIVKSHEPEKPKEGGKVIKVFLASSEELLADRDQFEIFLSRENDHLFDKGIRIQLVRWENFLDVVSNTRLQDEYNNVLRTCDMAVCLFYTKVGKYTAEEFDAALGQFRGAGKPLILTYFKDAPVKPSELRAFKTVLDFKDKLSELGHFPNHYESIGDLKHHFGEQLKKLGIS
jgi:tetratricopeptide (TPR) repeat protein